MSSMATESSSPTVTPVHHPWQPRGQGVLLVVLLAILWFSFLGYRDLNEPDEGRYAEIPREMFVSGDWLTPRLNGLSYFEKPPLQYWATASFYHLLGVHAGSSRLWTALMGFVGILWVWWVGGRLFGPTAGRYAALVLTSLLLYTVMGHFNTLDMATSVWLMLGIGLLLLAQSRRVTEPRACRRQMLLGWAALAGACLSKGLIGLLIPAATVLIYSVWQRDGAIWRHLHLGWGLLLLFALSAPWFVAVSLANPDFAPFFFIHEHLERYTRSGHGRSGVWWYFIGVLLLGTIPWSHRLLWVLGRPGFPWMKGDGHFDPLRFLWVYSAFVLLFFSASHSKLIPYLLPIFPALALLLGRQLAQAAAPVAVDWETRLSAILAVLLLLGGWQVELFANATYPAALLRESRPWIVGAATLLGVGVAISLWRRCRGEIALLALVLSTLLTVQAISAGAHALSPTFASRNAAQAIAALGDPPPTVYCVNCYFQSLPFYLERTVRLVHFQGELAFGIRQNPAQWIADKGAFKALWLQEEQAVALFDRDDFSTWREPDLPMRIIHQDGRRVVIARR
ncbi:MAG: glycosyltransferase family 39 protein [Magnetococcales bacterium]|nr:glycosyltransferase family 39 protein [Magnetococcales bacterium]